jgi:hypothetical protein
VHELKERNKEKEDQGIKSAPAQLGGQFRESEVPAYEHALTKIACLITIHAQLYCFRGYTTPHHTTPRLY